MLRFSYGLIALITVLPIFMAMQVDGQTRSAPTNPLPPRSTETQPADAAIPLCYIQMENGQLRDLRRLCGKRSSSPALPRSVQQPRVQPGYLDSDDDESAPRASPQPQTGSPTASPIPTPTTATSNPPQTSPVPTGTPSLTNAVPQPAVSPSPRTLDRPTTAQPVATPPPPSVSHPLAIPQDRD